MWRIGGWIGELEERTQEVVRILLSAKKNQRNRNISRFLNLQLGMNLTYPVTRDVTA